MYELKLSYRSCCVSGIIIRNSQFKLYTVFHLVSVFTVEIVYNQRMTKQYCTCVCVSTCVSTEGGRNLQLRDCAGTINCLIKYTDQHSFLLLLKLFLSRTQRPPALYVWCCRCPSLPVYTNVSRFETRNQITVSKFK